MLWRRLVLYRVLFTAFLALVLSACGAGSALQNGGPITSLASLVEHKGTVPEAPLMASRLPTGSGIVTASLVSTPRSPLGGPSTFALISGAGAIGWIRDETAEAYLNSLVRRLEAGRKTHRPTRVFIIGRESYGAFATPDGEIIVTAGLLTKARSEAEIAAVLAHELSHIYLRHNNRELRTRATLDATALATQAGILSGIATEMTLTKNANGRSWTLGDAKAAQAKMFKAAQYGSWATTFFDDIVSNHTSREHEFEADMLGIDLLVQSGYPPIAMKRMLEYKLREWEEDEKQRSTLSERFGHRIGASMQVSLFGAVMGGGVGHIAASLRDEFIDFAKAEVGRAVTHSHPSPGARVELTAGYIEKHHATTEGTEDVVGGFERALRAGRIKKVLAGYQHFFGAMMHRIDGKLDAALASVKAGLEGPLSKDPGGRNLAYQILLEMNDREAAYAMLSGARHKNGAPIGFYASLAWEYAVRGKRQDAMALLEEGGKVYGDPSVFLPTRIRILKSLNNQPMLAATLTACRNNPHQEVREACQNAAGGGDGTIASGRTGKGLLQQAAQPGQSGQQGFSTLLQNMTGIKLPGPF